MEHLQGQDLAALLASLGPPPVVERRRVRDPGVRGPRRGAPRGHRRTATSSLRTSFSRAARTGRRASRSWTSGSPSRSGCSTRRNSALHQRPRRLRHAALHGAGTDARGARRGRPRRPLVPRGVALRAAHRRRAVPGGVHRRRWRTGSRTRRRASLRATRPEIPDGLERIVLRCLERDRARRFPDARSLAIALEPYPDAQRRRTSPHAQGDDEEMTMIDHPAIESPMCRRFRRISRARAV